MTLLARLTVLLALILHVSLALGKPLHFGEVEEAWNQGLSDRDIHATAVATPSFFHEARSEVLRTRGGARAGSRHVRDFDSVLDERSLAASKAVAGGRRRRRGGDEGVVAAVLGFVEKRVVGLMREGGGEGEGGEREGEGGYAPVLRPSGGRRWG